MQTTPTTSSGDSRRQAFRGLALFFIVVALSAPIQAMIIAADLGGGENGVVAWLISMTALMPVQISVSVITRMQRTKIHPRPGERTNHELWIAS